MRKQLARHSLLAAVLALCVFAGVSAGSARPRGHSARGGGGSPVSFNRLDYKYMSGLSYRAEARRYGVLVLQAMDGRYVRILHRYNHSLKILLYQDFMASASSDPGALLRCTAPAQDFAHHPDWFLRGSNGRPLVSGPNFIMNGGNSAYQSACVAHAVALARHYGFNGLFIDGIGAKLDYNFPGGVVPHTSAFPTLGSWQSAMYRFLSVTAAGAHPHGLLVIDNLGGSVATPGIWQKWQRPIDGALEESWTDGNVGLAQQLPWWTEKLHQAAWSVAHHKILLLHSYNATEAGNRYGLASMMLIAGAHTSYSTSNPSYVGYEKWYPEYTTARSLGRAVGRYRNHHGVYARLFAHGLVLVNPSLHTTRSISLPGTYTGPGLGRLRSVRLGPTSGLILRRVG